MATTSEEADEEERLRFEKVVTWLLGQVGPHIRRVTGVLNRLERYLNLKVPADPPESQRHVLFRFLELLKNLVDHARRVELAMTSAPRNFRSEHAKPLFPLGDLKWDKVLDVFLDKSVDQLDALEDALQSLSIFCTSVPLSLGYEGEPEITRKETILYLVEKCRLLNVQFSRIELFVINRYLPPPEPLVQEYLKVKQIHTNGLLSDEEFDDRRILIVERMVVNVSGRAYQPPPREVPKPVIVAAPPRQASPPPPEPAPAPKQVKSTPKVMPSMVLSGGSQGGVVQPEKAVEKTVAKPTAAPVVVAAPAPAPVVVAQPAKPVAPAKEEEGIWFETTRGKPKAPPAQTLPVVAVVAADRPSAGPGAATLSANNVSLTTGTNRTSRGSDVWFDEAGRKNSAGARMDEVAVELKPVTSIQPHSTDSTGTRILHQSVLVPGQTMVESKALDNLFGRDQVSAPAAAPPLARVEPARVELVKGEGSKTPSFSKKPLTMTVSSPKQATAGQRITIAVTIDNQTTKKANCLQVALYSAQKKEIDMQAMYPTGFPVGAKESPWSGNVAYSLPVSLFPDLYYISVEPIQKKDENLRVMNPLQIVERVSNWQENPTQIFETPLAEACKRDHADIPRIAIACVAFLSPRIADLEGVFRVSGSADRINQIRGDVDAGRPFDLSALEGTPHTVAGILKLLVRLMPEYARIADMEDGPYKVDKCKELAERMPREQYLFTAFFICFLRSVDELSSQNKMSAENLAIVFGPVLMKRKAGDNLIEMPKANKLVRYLIAEASRIFPDPPKP